MAAGEQIDELAYLLQDAATATSNGVWVEAKKFLASSIHVTGITNATVQIYGANTRTKPADATDHIKIGSDITADGIVSIAYPVRWLKAKISAYVSGTISAVVQGAK